MTRSKSISSFTIFWTYLVLAIVYGWCLIQLQRWSELGISDELLIFLFPAVLYYSVYYSRWLYYGLMVAAASISVWVIHETVTHQIASYHTLTVFLFAMIGTAETFRYLNRERISMESKLKETQDELEIRVKQRTQELMVSNQRLTVEIAERKKTEQALEHSIEEAQAANQAKSRFLANISHEIRTPLHGIIGLADLLSQTVLDKEQTEYLHLQKQSAQSLLALINDLLDFSKIEAGKMTFESIPFSIRETIEECLQAIQHSVKEKQLHLETTISEDVPEQCIGDPHRLAQIVNNLLSNAVKFSKQGTIRVRVEVQIKTAAGIVLYIQVADQGIGIPPGKHLAIFDAFEQADGSTTRLYGGTGLGLPISSQLVQLMGGKMWLESVKDRGSTFHFTVCLSTSSTDQDATATERRVHAANTEPSNDSETKRNRHILIVEDNAINRKIVTKMLEKRGYTVKVAVNGLSGLQMFERERFDIVIMDLQMPKMDGFETTFRMRELEQSNGTYTPIIALTAHAMKGDRERCLQAGMDRYLSKPVHAKELYETIDSLFDSDSSES